MSAEIAIDFGSSFTRVAEAGGAILFEEPTIAAVDADTGGLVAFGRDAAGLGARSAGRIRTMRPIRNGKLVDVDLAEVVLADVLSRCGVGRLERPRIVALAHVAQTPVQERAIERALRQAGARSVRVIEHPVAAAIGGGLPIADALGQMVVDIGGGTTDAALIALGGIVTSKGVDTGISDIDLAIYAHLHREEGVVVDRRTTDDLRVRVTASNAEAHGHALEVAGRDARTGDPVVRVIDGRPIADIVERALGHIFDAAIHVIASAPPDLADDILRAGLLLVGGGSLFPGIDRRLAAATGVAVHVPGDAGRLAVLGAARSSSVEDGLFAVTLRSVG